MATKPKSWQPQVNVNTKRMKSLMDNIRSDVVRRTRNCDDLDKWMTELSEYTTANCFTTGIHAAEATEIANQIANVVNQTSLPSGSNAELVKGTMAEACYTMVSRVGDDLKNEMRRIAVESYNAKNTPAQTAKLLGERIDSLSRSRCQAIARTETCRAANLANYLNAKEMGAKSYRVLCNDGCCEYCQEEYGCDESGGTGDTLYDIEDMDAMPPLHPNCRCTPVWSMEEPEGKEEEPVTEDETDTGFDQEKFDNIRTPQDIADFFRYDYSFGEFPKVSKESEILEGKDGRRYKVGNNPNKGKFHKFYDAENDCTIFFHQSLGKNLKDGLLIDTTNSGKGTHNMKDVVKMYNDAPKSLKEANTSITFTNRNSKYLQGYNRLLDKKWEDMLGHNAAFVKEITHGKAGAWIDIYKTCIMGTENHSLQRVLYHEMAHGLDNKLSSEWSRKGRFSDNPEGYAARCTKQTYWDKDFIKRYTTSEEIADGISSEYGKRHHDKTFSYSEDFADAVSMVAFKHIEDKSAATILKPTYTWKNQEKPYTYEEFVKEYPHKVEYLEEVLGI